MRKKTLITLTSLFLFSSWASSEPILNQDIEPWNKFFYAGMNTSKSHFNQDNAILYGNNFDTDSDYVDWSMHEWESSYYGYSKVKFNWSLTRGDESTIFSFGDKSLSINSDHKNWEGLGLLFNKSNKYGMKYNSELQFKLTSWNYKWLDKPISYTANTPSYDYYELIDSDNNRINEASGEIEFSWFSNYWVKNNKKTPELSFYLKGIDYSYVTETELTNDVPVVFGGVFVFFFFLIYKLRQLGNYDYSRIES